MLMQLGQNFDILSAIDIVIVAYVIYRVILLLQGTRAIQLFKGIGVLICAAILSRWLGLYTINWVLDSLMTMGLVAIPVIFQPELRKALEHLGRGELLGQPGVFLEEKDKIRLVYEIVRAVSVCAKDKIGALIVIERQTGLQDYADTGVALNAELSTELLLSIFFPNTPLHDGAVIIRGNLLGAANCLLPLTENEWVARELGTRHRSALGISEVSDAVGIAVSEESGVISLTSEGKISRYLDENTLRQRLYNIYRSESRFQRFRRQWWRFNRHGE